HVQLGLDPFAPLLQIRGIVPFIAAKPEHDAQEKYFQSISGGTGGGPIRLFPEFPGPIPASVEVDFQAALAPLILPGRIQNKNLVQPANQSITNSQELITLPGSDAGANGGVPAEIRPALGLVG